MFCFKEEGALSLRKWRRKNRVARSKTHIKAIAKLSNTRFSIISSQIIWMSRSQRWILISLKQENVGNRLSFWVPYSEVSFCRLLTLGKYNFSPSLWRGEMSLCRAQVPSSVSLTGLRKPRAFIHAENKCRLPTQLCESHPTGSWNEIVAITVNAAAWKTEDGTWQADRISLWPCPRMKLHSSKQKK